MTSWPHVSWNRLVTLLSQSFAMSNSSVWPNIYIERWRQNNKSEDAYKSMTINGTIYRNKPDLILTTYLLTFCTINTRQMSVSLSLLCHSCERYNSTLVIAWVCLMLSFCWFTYRKRIIGSVGKLLSKSKQLSIFQQKRATDPGHGLLG